MEIISLPEYLNLAFHAPLQVVDYQSTTNSIRSKISLNKNVFSFLREGTKEVIADNQASTIGPRRFLLMKSGNCLMTETVSAANRTYNSILLFFTDEMLFDFLERNQLHANRSKAAKAFHVCQYDSYSRHFVESLEKISRLDSKLQSSLLVAKFEEIMIYLIQQEGPAFLACLLRHHDSQTQRLLSVVSHNELNKLTLQELAFLSHMSISTFKREFEKHFQASPIKWFQEKRLAHAAFLLGNTAKRPSDIYEEVGYENLSNFIQAFKKHFGMTPKQFQLTK